QFEFEFDRKAVGVLVDKFGIAARPAAMVAEQRVGDRVENGGFAAAIGTGEHPQGGAFKADFPLVAVAEKAGEFDAPRNHWASSRMRVSARSSSSFRSFSSWFRNS